MTDALFTADFKDQPYWWDRTPRPATDHDGIPQRVDVAVIGSGYTGLCAAIQTARGGRETIVLDAEDAGWGCSTRNGGQISTSIKPGYEELASRYGHDSAFAVVKEGQNSLAWIKDFVAAEKIDCDFGQVGRFHAAHNPVQYEALARRLAELPKGLAVEAHMVPRAEQLQELGSEAYHGGAVFSQHCALDPGRFHQGLLERTQTAKVRVVSHCPVRTVERDGRGFRVLTGRGPVVARNVIVATNGYTGTLTPWLRRRVIPIGSYMIATEPLPEETMAQLMPKGRIVSDSRKLVYYYRPSPDRRRILFGGRVSVSETDPRVSGPRLHAELVRLFPALKDTKISHSWAGFVAYTFDTLAHIGNHEGLHYAMGYCGSGVGFASYLGTKIGLQVLGRSEGKTGLDGLPFPTRPLYWGDPWFLAWSIRYYRWRDQQNR